MASQGPTQYSYRIPSAELRLLAHRSARDGSISAHTGLFLLGTEMDYKVDKLSAQFTFKNPNETSACGCGESVQLTPADHAGAC